MQKLGIAPFTRSEFALISSLAENYVISSLISPKGIGKEGEDIGVFRNCDPIGLTFTNDIVSGVSNLDVLLVSYVPQSRQTLYLFALEALEIAAKHGKEIHCFLDIEEDKKKRVESICRENGGKCFFFEAKSIATKYKENMRLFQFDIPIFYISETLPDCDGYDVFLNLANRLSEKGYRVLAISDNRYNEFLGYTTIDFDAPVDIKYQTFRINSIMQEQIRLHQPDVVVLLLPRPMVQFSVRNPFDCGTMAYIISQAIPGAGCIFCTHQEAADVHIWNHLEDKIAAKFGMPILAIHVSNRMIDGSSDTQLASVRVPYCSVAKQLDNISFNSHAEIPFLQLTERNSLIHFVETLISEYIDLPYGVI